MLAWLGDHSRGFGTSGGAVMTELFFPDGSVRRGVVSTRRNGQLMAALPCVRGPLPWRRGRRRRAGQPWVA